MTIQDLAIGAIGPPISSLLFRVSLGFIGSFFVAIYGACLYNKRRVLGSSLIGVGTLSAAGAIGYFLYSLR